MSAPATRRRVESIVLVSPGSLMVTGYWRVITTFAVAPALAAIDSAVSLILSMQVFLDFGAERADGSVKLHFVGDDVEPNAAVDAADRKNRGRSW